MTGGDVAAADGLRDDVAAAELLFVADKVADIVTLAVGERVSALDLVEVED